MPHIALTHQLPGISGLLAHRPDTAAPLTALAEQLMVAENSLTREERELIATYVSRRNGCVFCSTSHGAVAAMLHGEDRESGWDVVDAVWADPTTAPVSPKLRALLAIAAAVQRDGKLVTDELVETARAAQASDDEIHDTVLIAAAFCMFNRYVDGLATVQPVDREVYLPGAERIRDRGYLAR